MPETIPVDSSQDIVRVRQVVRTEAAAQGLSLVDQTKIVTAASELARNMVNYAGRGTVHVERVVNGARLGLKVSFEDEGPGIPDIELAMKEGYTSGDGLGLGLPGSRRLVNEFTIDSEPGRGTRVVITRWR
jgi:serine/threonine-protein kinase RsbT